MSVFDEGDDMSFNFDDSSDFYSGLKKQLKSKGGKLTKSSTDKGGRSSSSSSKTVASSSVVSKVKSVGKVSSSSSSSQSKSTSTKTTQDKRGILQKLTDLSKGAKKKVVKKVVSGAKKA